MHVFVMSERRWFFQMCWSNDITDDARATSVNVWAAVTIGGENTFKIDEFVLIFDCVFTYY